MIMNPYALYVAILHVNGRSLDQSWLGGSLCCLGEKRNEAGEKDIVDASGQSIPNKKMQLCMYCTLTYMKFGHLGRGNRIPLPSCVTSKIKDMYPQPATYYTGFCQLYLQQEQMGMAQQQEQNQQDKDQEEEEDDKEEDEEQQDEQQDEEKE